MITLIIISVISFFLISAICVPRERVNAAARIFSYENILKRYYDCRRHKRYTINAAKFELHFEAELLKLKKELDSHTYRPGRSLCFVVTKPKLREIFAADFRDRVVHHILVDYLEPIWESIFIGQSYACRKGKGTHRAIKDLQRYIHKVSQNNRATAYYLQIDIESFFVSLKKDILFSMIRRKVKNPEVLWLAKTIIYHNPTAYYHRKGQTSLFDLVPDNKSLFKVPPGQGLPIGNLTSQFFANVYLNDLDQFIRHKLKVKYYLRYVDDLLLLSSDKDQLKFWREEINTFLVDKLKLRLHPQKQTLRDICQGIDFLGFVVKPGYTLMRRRIVRNLKDKLWEFNKIKSQPQRQEAERILSMVNSYYGQFRHANTFGLRQKLWHRNFGKLKDLLAPVDKEYRYFKINNLPVPSENLK